jgi:hypothetical protein
VKCASSIASYSNAAAVALAVHDPSRPWSKIGGRSGRGSTSVRSGMPKVSAIARLGSGGDGRQPPK